MLKVAEYVQEYGWEKLAFDFGIKVKHYAAEGVTVLNYDQINSPKSHPIVMECRGLILYTEALTIAAKAFDRFFNYGEVPEITKSIDFSDATVYEKADGSLIKVWYCYTTAQWEISTRGTAFAESGNEALPRFRDGVLIAFGCNESEFQERMNSLKKSNTYIFEYVAPENRIVTRYDNPEMIYLGTYHHMTDMDSKAVPSFVEAFNKSGLKCRMVKEYPLDSEEHVLRAVNELGGLQEGFVVRDNKTGIRTKIKSIAYVAVHNMRDNGVASTKRIAELVLANEHEEYLTYFPEDKDLFDNVIAQYKKLVDGIAETWEKFKHIEDQKEFATQVKDFKYSGILFATKKHPSKNPKIVFDEAKLNFKVDMVLAQ